MKNYLSRFTIWLIAVLIFVTPSNLFLKFVVSDAYVNGVLVDYLIPKLFVSDVLILLIVFLGVFEILSKWQIKKPIAKAQKWLIKNKPLVVTTIAVLSLFIIRQFFTERPIFAVYQLLKIAEFSILTLILHQKKEALVQSKIIFFALVLAVTFQSVLGFYQVFNQAPLAPYHLLGETQLNQSVGIARHTIGGIIYTAPYGTTSHPNVLGGFLAIYILLVIQLYRNSVVSSRQSIIVSGALALGVIALVSTGSVSAGLCLLLGLIYVFGSQYWMKITAGLGWLFFLTTTVLLQLVSFLHISDSLSITRRVVLNEAAFGIWKENLFGGVGLQHFLINLETFSQSQEVVRFIQPAHHLGWLWLSETGILGLVILLLTIYWLRFSNSKNTWIMLGVSFMPLIPLLSLDHYLYTTQTGSLFFIWWAVLHLKNQQFN